jgi:integrase
VCRAFILRHTGNTLAAATGVSTRDLMARMRHDSINAAIIHQHVTHEADHDIADALDAGIRISGRRDKRHPGPEEATAIVLRAPASCT